MLPSPFLMELFLDDAIEMTAEKSSLEYGRLSQWIRNRRSCSFPSLLMGVSQLGSWNFSHPSLFQARVRLPRVPRLLSLLASMGKRRSFEVSLFPSQLQMVGILGWRQHSLSSYRVEDWTMEVLCYVYLVPFHAFLLCHGNLLNSLPTHWGLPKLRHLKEKWTRCCRKTPWN